ncbi:MAG: hypothetical protein IKJ82_07255 [Oscillospiraceae bacterium]|nr:hypothetical protein [Oscillospiraceae bacterium]
MGFLKLFSQKEKPNYKTVDTLNNLKVVDVVSMNDLGSAINADNRFLMKSGTAYWNMEVPHLGAEKNPGTARNFAVLFFMELWKRGYAEEDPKLGKYIGLLYALNGASFSDDAENVMRIYLESEIMNLDTRLLWFYSMVYTSFCGGSYENIIAMLRKRAETDLLNKNHKNFRMVLPVLRHYLALKNIKDSFTFQKPAPGENLYTYWKEKGLEYLSEDGLLEYALIGSFLANNPFENYKDICPDEEDAVLRPDYAEEEQILRRCAYIKNPLALAAVSDPVFDEVLGSIKKELSDLETVLEEESKTALLSGGDFFDAEVLSAKKKTELIPGYKKAFEVSAFAFAKALCCYAFGETDKAKEALSVAAGERKNLSGAFYKSAAFRDYSEDAEKMLRNILAREKGESVSSSDMTHLERLAFEINTGRGALKIHTFGKYFRNGYYNLPPYPEFYEICRKNVPSEGGYGKLLFVLDGDIDSAKEYFSEIIENKNGKYSESEVAFAHLGMAKINLENKEYKIKDALAFVKTDSSRFKSLPDKVDFETFMECCEREIGDPPIYYRKREDLSYISFLAKFYYGYCDSDTDVSLWEDLGSLFYYYASEKYRYTVKALDSFNLTIYDSSYNKTDDGKHICNLIDDWARLELEFCHLHHNISSMIFYANKFNAPYALSLFGIERVMRHVTQKFTNFERFIALGIAKENGYPINEELYRELHKAVVREIDSRPRKKTYSSSVSSSGDTRLFDIDSVFDAIERLGNGGLTNKELFMIGQRNAYQDMDDDLERAFAREIYR